MGTMIGPLHVRRSVWIDAPPQRVWREFESFESLRRWYGTGHALLRFEPWRGGVVETDASNHHSAGSPLLFRGEVLVFEPPTELTFSQDWVGTGGARRPSLRFASRRWALARWLNSSTTGSRRRRGFLVKT